MKTKMARIYEPMIKSTSMTMKHIYICKYIHTLEAIEPTRIENRYQREDED